MRTPTRLFAVLLVGGLAAGCAEGRADVTPDDSEAPLSNYDDLMADAPDNGALPDENKADAIYPAKFTELLQWQTPVKSQGSRGVCSIFATVALMEHLYLKAGETNPDFSEQYLQWSVKVEGMDYTYTEGSNADANLSAIYNYGVVAETDWPYESFPWTAANDAACGGEESARPVKCFTNGEPPASALSAPKFKLPRGRWLNTNSIKAHMTTKHTAVVVGLDFFYQSWNHRRSTLPVNAEAWRQGYVLYPNAKDVEESHTHRAGHAIELVGWDDELAVPTVDAEGKPVLDADGNPVLEKGFYIFKNSWGTSGFGIANEHGAGYGYLSMKYVTKYGSVYISDVPVTTPPPPPPPGGMNEHYTASPALAIPDNTPAGVASELQVPTTGAIAELTVTVDISHPYVGDLMLQLTNGTVTVTLQDRIGGADDDLKKAFTLSQFVGAERGGTWRLTIVDTAAQDVGTLNSWSLDLR